MYNSTEKFIYKLKKINRQKVLWYKLSLFFILGLVFFIYEQDLIKEKKLENIFLFFGLIISSVWWYWTMGVLSTLLQIKNLQLEILNDILYTIKEIKKDAKDS